MSLRRVMHFGVICAAFLAPVEQNRPRAQGFVRDVPQKSSEQLRKEENERHFGKDHVFIGGERCEFKITSAPKMTGVEHYKSPTPVGFTVEAYADGFFQILLQDGTRGFVHSVWMSRDDEEEFRTEGRHCFFEKSLFEILRQQALEEARLKLSEQQSKQAQETAIRREALRASLPDVALGMTSKQVLNTNWGEPVIVNRSERAGLTQEQWLYGGGRYLVLNNGRVVSISTRRR